MGSVAIYAKQSLTWTNCVKKKDLSTRFSSYIIFFTLFTFPKRLPKLTGENVPTIESLLSFWVSWFNVIRPHFSGPSSGRPAVEWELTLLIQGRGFWGLVHVKAKYHGI